MPDDERRLEYMPLTEIIGAERNPKRHDKLGIDKSMRKFGVVELPALDERTGRLVAGHGRLDSWAAAQAAGANPPGGIKVADDGTWLAPVIRGWSSNNDEEASAYLVASNQLTINGGWDDRALAELLDDISAKDDTLLQVTGIDDEQLDKLLSMTDAVGDPAAGFLADLRDPFGTTDAPPPPQGPPPYDWSPSEHNPLPPAGSGALGGGSSFDEPVSPAAPAEQQFTQTSGYSPAGTAAAYAPVSWVLHEDDRRLVRTALTHLQKTRDIPTSAAALVALCRDYTTANNLADKPASEPLEGAAQ